MIKRYTNNSLLRAFPQDSKQNDYYYSDSSAYWPCDQMALETGTIAHIWHLFSTGKVLLSEICSFLSSGYSPKGKTRNAFLQAPVDYSRFYQATTMLALVIQNSSIKNVFLLWAEKS